MTRQKITRNKTFIDQSKAKEQRNAIILFAPDSELKHKWRLIRDIMRPLNIDVHKNGGKYIRTFEDLERLKVDTLRLILREMEE